MNRYALPLNILLWGVLFFVIRWPAWNIIVAINLTVWMLWWHCRLYAYPISPPVSNRIPYLLASLALAGLGIAMYRIGLPGFGLVLIWGTASLMVHYTLSIRQK